MEVNLWLNIDGHGICKAKGGTICQRSCMHAESPMFSLQNKGSQQGKPKKPFLGDVCWSSGAIHNGLDGPNGLHQSYGFLGLDKVTIDDEWLHLYMELPYQMKGILYACQGLWNGLLWNGKIQHWENMYIVLPGRAFTYIIKKKRRYVGSFREWLQAKDHF